MAQDRFYFWRGYYDALKKMPTDEHRGEFVMAICAYAFDGEEPDFGGDAMLDMGWSLVADAVRESVAIGRSARERGRKGGRPSKGKKTSAKTSAFSRAKTSAKTVEYGSVLSPSTTEREFATLTGACAPAPDGAARAPVQIDPMLDVPPKPEGA